MLEHWSSTQWGPGLDPQYCGGGALYKKVFKEKASQKHKVRQSLKTIFLTSNFSEFWTYHLLQMSMIQGPLNSTSNLWSPGHFHITVEQHFVGPTSAGEVSLLYVLPNHHCVLEYKTIRHICNKKKIFFTSTCMNACWWAFDSQSTLDLKSLLKFLKTRSLSYPAFWKATVSTWLSRMECGPSCSAGNAHSAALGKGVCCNRRPALVGPAAVCRGPLGQSEWKDDFCHTEVFSLWISNKICTWLLDKT